MKTPQAKVKQRPAESAGLLGALVFAAGRYLGWPDELTNVLAVAAAAVPSLVTFLVERFRSS